MLEVMTPPSADETEHRARMRIGSERLLKAIRLGRDEGWPCGHLKDLSNTQTVAGVSRCRECRRKRWLKGFQRAKIFHIVQRMDEIKSSEPPRTIWPKWYEPPRERYGIADRLCESVAWDFHTNATELRGAGRCRHLVHARAVVQRILKERGWSYPQVARAVGRKDHSTAIHAIASFDIYERQNELVGLSYSKHKGFSDAA